MRGPGAPGGVRILLLAGLLSAVPAGGSGPARAASPPDPEGPEAEDNDAALAVLDAAGVPPTSGEIRGALGADAQDAAGWAGGWRTRSGWGAAGWEELASRLEVGRGAAWARGRIRFRDSGIVDRVAVVGVRTGTVEILAGRLGMRRGFGLAAAGPGRNPSLAADSPLGMPRDGPRAWTGQPDERTRLGLGFAWTVSGWRLGFLAGRSEGGGHGVPAGVVHLEKRGGSLRWGLTGLAEGTRRAGGITAAVERGGLTLWGEGVVWRRAPGTLPPWGLQLAARWRAGPGFRLEASWAAADRPSWWESGSRGALLPGDRGRGFALRLQARAADRIILRALIHEGIAEPTRPDGGPWRRRLLDLQAERTWGGGLRALVRVRRWSKTAWAFSVRHPWLPPEAATTGLKTVYGLRLVQERGRLRIGVLVRSLGQETPDRPGRRTLLSITARWRHPEGWRARGFATTAWGDDVDLVSAVVPLDGWILPRHWGRWRSGAGGGLGWVGPALGIQAAAGLRRPEPDRGETPEAWAGITGEWRW